MNTVHSFLLAGQMDDLGNGWIDMLNRWADKGLQTGLVCLVVIVMIQKFSMKAGIGALLLMAVALGLYNSRNDLAAMFTDEVKHPSKSAPAVPGVVRSTDPLARAHSGGAEGGL